MASTSFGVLITGDSRGAVKAIDLTSKQIKDLEGTTEKASRKIKSETTGAADGFSNMAKSAAKMGAAVGAAAAALGGMALRKVITETSESERVMAQLSATLKSTGGVAGKTAQELANTATALQKMTTYSDEAIISAQALLASFKNVNKDGAIFDRTTRAILDLSTALGTDLKSSALQLGKALENPTKGISALTRSGVSFSEAQKEVIKSLAESGRLAEAQTLILKELETQFGGSAAAARDTMGGALTALNIAWGDLFEVQGKASAGMTQSINELNATISDPAFKSAMDSVTSGLIDITNWSLRAAGGLVQTFKYITRSDGPLTKLKEEIDDVSAALTRAENKGFWREADKQRAKLAALKKEYEELGKKVNAANRPIEQLSPIMVTAEQRTTKLTIATQSLAKSCDAVKASVADLSPIIVTATKRTSTLATTTVDAAATTSEAWSETRNVLSDFFFEMAADGQNAFNVLINGFRRMLTMMIAEAAANRILLAVGIGGTSAGAAAAGTAATAGGGSILSGITGFGGSLVAGGQGLYEAIGTLLSNNGLTKLGDMAYTKGLNTTGLSMGLDIGGGILGGYLGNKVFGQTSGIGQAVGGLAGSILIPIPGVGAAVGSFLGGGVESLFGGKNNGNNRGMTNFNLATGANVGAGIGKTFDQGNVDTATGLASMLQQFAAAIGGSSLAGNITVGKGKINYGGKSYATADAFLGDAYTDIMRKATQLTTNTVTSAITEMTKTQETAMQSYRTGTEELLKQISAFDGTRAASEKLATSLMQNKTAAYEFAMAIQTIGKNLGAAAEEQANYYREAGMTPQQILDKRIGQSVFLQQGLAVQTDPEKIAAIQGRILSLNRQIFDSVSPDQQAAYAGTFAQITEQTNATAQALLQKSLQSLETTQATINEKMVEMVNKQQLAADTQLQAANLMLQAAQANGGRGQVAV